MEKKQEVNPKELDSILNSLTSILDEAERVLHREQIGKEIKNFSDEEKNTLNKQMNEKISFIKNQLDEIKAQIS